MATSSRLSAVEFDEWLFAIPGYSQLGDSCSTLVKTFYFRRQLWLVRVSSFSSVKGMPNSLYIYVYTDMKHSVLGTTVSIEILNHTWEHTVFRDEHALTDDACPRRGFLLVGTRDLEAASCVHNDNVPVRCTLTFRDTKKQQRKAETSKFKSWCRLKACLSSRSETSLSSKHAATGITSIPRSYSPFETPTESDKWLFAIPGYSKLGLMDSCSWPILVKTLYFRRHLWRVEVFSSTYVNGVPTTLCVYVTTDIKHSASGTTISIEILNDTLEDTVFYNESTLNDDTCHGCLFVKRSELEVSSCVRNDDVPIRCTLTFLDIKKQGGMDKEQQQVAKYKYWDQLTTSLPNRSEISMGSKPTTMGKRPTPRSYSLSSPTESEKCLFPIPNYSKLGLMINGSAPILIKTLYFHQHLWRVEVCPLHFIKGVPTYICILVSTDIKSSALGTTVSIEILNNAWEHTVFHDEHMLDEDSWRHAFLAVKRSELEMASCVHNDCIPVRCTLTFVDVEEQGGMEKEQERKEEQGGVEKEQQRQAATSNFKSWYRRLRKSFLADPKSKSDIKTSSCYESGSNLTPLLDAKYGRLDS